MKRVKYLALVWLVVISLGAFALADDDDYGPSGGQQPDVARVSLIHGDVSMQRGDSGDWTAATINTPMVRGDQVATGEKSRAEIQLDYANILRLSSQSQAKIADLTRTHIQIQIAQGYANYSQFKGSEADVEIDTPNVAVHPLRHGRYRIQVNSDSETDVIVREGEAEVTTPQGSTTVKEGQQITVRGTDNPEYRVDSAPGRDDWDRFNKDRDSVIRDAQSWRRTNSYYTGSSDLDGYGHWVFVPGYGWVWQPYQQASWAPYQAGRWVWEPYWGWTWVSYEPWGWAPYHYGRWFVWGGSWVWWPGPVYTHYRPIWAPAFVTFIGFGHHSSFAFGFGSIGWLPCGPHDYFYPWYGRGFNQVNVVNITNINIINRDRGHFIGPLAGRGRGRGFSNIDMAHRDPRWRAGISGLPAEQFGRGNVQVRRLTLREGDLRDSRVMTANLPVVPTRESLRAGGDRPVQMRTQPRNVDRFYTRRQPPQGPPAFHDQADRMQRVVREHAPNAQIPQTRGNEGQGRGDFRTQPVQVPRTDGNAGAQNRGNGRVLRPGEADQPSGGNRDGGFRGFGDPGGSQPAGSNNPAGRVGRVGTPQGNQGSPNNNPSQDRRGRGDWTKFSPPAGGGRTVDPGDPGRSGSGMPASRDNVRVPRTDRAPAPASSGPGAATTPANEDRGGFRRFPSGGDRAPRQPEVNQPSNPRGNDGGFQRFPSGGSRPSDSPANPGRDRSDPGGKPPLVLDRPIVTPRNPDMQRDRSGPPPSRMPDRSEPRYSPPPSRGPEVRSEPRYSPPPSRGPEVRSEPRYSPPPSRGPEVRSAPSHDRSYGGGGGGGNRGGGGERGGGGNKGGDKGSKSSSNPRNR